MQMINGLIETFQSNANDKINADGVRVSDPGLISNPKIRKSKIYDPIDESASKKYFSKYSGNGGGIHVGYCVEHGSIIYYK